MIDFKSLLDHQKNGMAELDQLTEEELPVFIAYCSMVADDYGKLANSTQMNIDELVVNSFRSGVALGLKIKVDQGQLLRRADG